MAAMGSLHTAHWHANTVMLDERATDVVPLMPAEMHTVDMVAENPPAFHHLAPTDTRCFSSSKKFSRTVTCVMGFGSDVPSAYRATAKRLPSGVRS